MKILLVLGLLLAAAASFADGLNMDPNGPTVKQVEAVQIQFEKAWMAPNSGVNGVGISACDEATGYLFTKFNSDLGSRKFVNCLDVMTATRAAQAQLIQRYPLGSRVAGVYIYVEFGGPIVAQ